MDPSTCSARRRSRCATAPDYKSARHNPDINKCFYTIVGFEDAHQVSDYILQAYGGQIPDRPGAGTWVNSLWDPSQAPAGMHAMNGWFFFPNASCLSPEEWDDVRRDYNGKFLELWGTLRSQHDARECNR